MKRRLLSQETLKNLVVLVVLLLVGCALPLSPTITPTVAPTKTVTPSPVPTEVAVVSSTRTVEDVELQFWVPDFLYPSSEAPEANVLSKQVEDFSHTIPGNIPVRILVKKESGTGGLYDLLSTASEVAPTVLPDLLILNERDLIAAAGQGLIQPLDSYLSPIVEYFPAALDAMRTGNGTWGLPYVANAEQMAYRQGVTVTAPLSWTAVLTGGYTMLFPAGPPDNLASDVLLSIYLGSGGRVMDEAGLPMLERSSLIRVYGFFSEMRAAGLLDPDLALSLPNTKACWAVYQQGTGWLTPVSIGQFWQSPLAGTLPAWPPTATGEPVTVLHTWGLAMVTQDPLRQEAALQLMLWLSSAQQMAELTRSLQLVPTRQEAIEAWGLSTGDTAFLTRLLTAGVPSLPPTVDSVVRRALQAGLSELLQQETVTPEEAAGYALVSLRH